MWSKLITDNIDWNSLGTEGCVQNPSGQKSHGKKLETDKTPTR